MSDSFTAMVRWAKRSLLLSKQGKELIMNEENKDPHHLEVAIEVTEFLKQKYGKDIDDPAVLEGMWLAMQMVGGPRSAAAVINYCSVKTD